MVDSKPPVTLPLNIVQTYQDTVTNSTKNIYKVPKGTLTINEWWVGTQKFYTSIVKAKKTVVKTSSLKVAIYWDKKGDGNNMQLIDTVYTSKATYDRKLTSNNVFVSDGKGRIIVHQWVYGENGPRETFVRWAGQVV